MPQVHLSFSGEGMLDSEVRTYAYDEAGNIESITTVTDAGTYNDERTHNDLNQLTEQVVGGDTWTFSYDDNGNMTGKSDGTDTWMYSWSDDNRLIRVQGPSSVDVHYSYEAMGRMLTRDDGTGLTQFTWDDVNIVRETTGELETIYHIPDGQILSFIRDGVTYQAHSCGLGSIRTITDEGGEVVARYDFDAWGRAISLTEDSALSGFPMRFIGSLGVRFDGLSGLHYMRARWFDSHLQRFVSRDPIGLQGGSNLYNYVGQNPVNGVDPSGVKPIEVHNPSYPYDVIEIDDPETGCYARKQLPRNECDLSPLEKLRAMAGQHQLPSWINAENAGYVLLAFYVYGTWGSGNQGTFGGGRRGKGRLPGGGVGGPAMLELSATSRTAENLANLPSKPMEFIFDGERFVVGPMKHNDLAEKAGMCGKLRGGTIWQRKGKIFTNEMSGSFHQNWNEQTRQQFKTFMSEQGVLIKHKLGF